MALCLCAGYFATRRAPPPATVIEETIEADGVRGGIGIIEPREPVEERAEPGNDLMVDDSPIGQGRIRYGRRGRGHHGGYPPVASYEDFEDEYVVGHVDYEGDEGVEGEWGVDDGDEGDEDDEGVGGGRLNRVRLGTSSGCASSLLCVLASAAGTGPAPSLSGAGAYAYGRAREDFRAGRFLEAAAGFATAAASTTVEVPSAIGDALRPAARGAADRDLLCLQAAAALIAAGTDDGTTPPAAGREERPALLAALGPCAPQLHHLVGPGPASSDTPTRLPDDRDPRPDVTHL